MLRKQTKKLPNILVPINCINFFFFFCECIAVITICASDVWDNIGLCLITIWVVELMYSKGWWITFLKTGLISAGLFFLTVMESHSSHCFKCGVKMSVSLTDGGFPRTLWNEISHVKSCWFHSSSHCNFYQLLFRYLSPMNSWTASSGWRNLFVYHNLHLKLLC